MTLSLVPTADWEFERVAAYGPQITAALNRLKARFPNDVDVQATFDEMISGRLLLWLIMDGDAFKAMLLTRTEFNERTKRKQLVGVDLAGEGGVEIASLVSELEAYADREGYDEVVLLGRLGWRKALAKQGYEIATVNYRKVIEIAEIEEAA